MKDKKRTLINILIILCAVVSIIIISLSDSNINSKRLIGSVSESVDTSLKPSTYYDWSALTSIDNDYSYSTVLYTKDTKFYANATGSDSTLTYSTRMIVDGENNPKATPMIELYNEGDEASIIVTNCGVDKDGNTLSAVLHIKVKKMWGEYSKENRVAKLSMTRLGINKNGQVNPQIGNDQTDPSNNPSEDIKTSYNMPLSFYLNTQQAQVDADLKYYKASDLKLNVDSKKKITTKENNELSVGGQSIDYATISGGSVNKSIDKINTFYWDIDITRPENDIHSDYVYDMFNGHEGIAPLNGTSKVYYKKDGSKEYSMYSLYEKKNINLTYSLAEANNGIYISQNSAIDNGQGTSTPQGYNQEGVWYATSSEFLTSNVQGEYDFAYGSRSCGIVFMFASPLGYSIEPPIKTVSKANTTPTKGSINVTSGEKFYFEISQYIPNNYYSNYIDFSRIYNNFSSDNYLKEFSFTDSINNDLTIDQNGITVTDMYGTNLSDFYKVTVNNNVVKTTETQNAVNYYNSSMPYNNIIKIKIPASYNKVVTESKTIPNTGKTATKIGGGKSKDQNTNEVKVILTPGKTTTCDLTITSTTFKIDSVNKVISVENTVTNEQIISGIKTTSTLSIEGDNLIVECDGQTEKYKIQRYWIAQTGNNVVKYGLIIGVLIIAITALFIVNKKSENK